jgi:indolepyruvate decarboxylase
MQYGSIGWSVGATLGAALGASGRRIITLVGDGSFQLTAQELSTIIRQRVKATVLLLNNKGYTIEVEIHDGPYNDIQNWNYAALIDVFNGDDGNGIGLKAGTSQELADALATANQHDGLTFIECMLSRDDCTSDLLLWGSHVASANGRPPSFT